MIESQKKKEDFRSTKPDKLARTAGDGIEKAIRANENQEEHHKGR